MVKYSLVREMEAESDRQPDRAEGPFCATTLGTLRVPT